MSGVGRILPILAGAALFVSGAAARAQTIDCNRLAVQINSLGRDASAQRYAAAAQKQSLEIARTAAYARSIGCERVQFLFFGGPKPPQCDGLNARLSQMQANLMQLQRASTGDGSLKRRLQDQYDSYCRQSRNILDDIFSKQIEPDNPQPQIEDETPQWRREQGPRGGSYAVCVRTCDGGFFPVSYTAQRANLSDLQELCSALCPNAEVKVYTRPIGGDISKAVAADGAPYSDLENAFKFQKTRLESCGCKPKDKSWAEALASAEDLIEKRQNDVVVTPEKAAAMAKATNLVINGVSGPNTKLQFKPDGKERPAKTKEARKPADEQGDTPAGAFDPEEARKFLRLRRDDDLADAPPPALPEDAETSPTYEPPVPSTRSRRASAPRT